MPHAPFHPRSRATLFFAWLPLAVLLPLAASQLEADPIQGLWIGTYSALIGAALMAAAWSIPARFSWPEQPAVRFFLAHLAAAVLFAVAWRTAVLLVVGLTCVSGPMAEIRSGFASPFVLWDLMLKIVVYGLVIGLSHAVHEGDRARAERVRSARVEALASRAQLAALRAQLNPHFLFNTLHSLTELIRSSPTVAEEAVERLGALLRFALRHSGAEDISLGEELAFVRDYLAIESLRLGERLHIEIVVDEDTLGVAVPPFCLQPLVENAIRHGLSPKPEGGTLRLTAHARSGSLALFVSDDGVGAGPEPWQSRGSGLASLSRRIGLGREDGGDGGLEITTSRGRGFAVGFTLPIEDATIAIDGGTIRVAVADDEPLARQKLRGLLAKVDWVEQVGEAANGAQTIELVNRLRPDVLCLDIRMPGLDGFQILGHLRHLPAIIFTTAHHEYAVAAFAARALDYLLKPFGEARFRSALDHAREAIVRGTDSESLRDRVHGLDDASRPVRRLFVRGPRGINPIEVKDALRFEASDDYVTIHLPKGKLLASIRMDELERVLDPDRFLRIHRSHIVNLDAVVSMAPHPSGRFVVALRDGVRLFASRARSREVRRRAV